VLARGETGRQVSKVGSVPPLLPRSDRLEAGAGVGELEAGGGARLNAMARGCLSSFGEDEHTFSAFPRPTTEDLRSQDMDGSDVTSSDEIGENRVVVKRVPATPKRKGVAKSPPPKKNRGKVATAPSAVVEEDATSAVDSYTEAQALRRENKHHD
jgi:hypothetical protein